MNFPTAFKSIPKPTRLAVVAIFLLAVLGWHSLFTVSYGAQLGNRSLQLNTNEASAKADYLLSFTLATAGTLGSIDVQFCSNDPLPATPCTAPAGFDDSSAILSSQTGPGGFTISGASTANDIILTRTPAATPITATSYNFTGVVNPSAPGSYFVRVQTFAAADASGPASDYGGIAFDINNQLMITAEVPPYLLFCTGTTIPGLNCVNANGDFIDFGNLSASRSNSGSSQLLVATNAANGYAISVGGTTMTSGNNIIAALANNDVSRPGTPQFGFNLRANSAPAVGSNPTGPGVSQPQPNYDQPNSFRFVNGDTIIANPVPDEVRVYTASYLVNVPPAQAPGIYVTTLTYVCLADF